MKLFNKKKCKHHFHRIKDTERLILYPHPDGCITHSFVDYNPNHSLKTKDIIIKNKCCKCGYEYMSLIHYYPTSETRGMLTVKYTELKQYCNELGFKSYKEK